ncbi:MAG: phage holin family protein [Planctomycetota bacterium]|jgi:hypothetical protein
MICIRRTKIICPYCKTTLDKNFGDTTLTPFGEPFVTCPHCGGKCKTGVNYWCNMTPQEKANAKEKAITAGVLIFLVLSVLLETVGLIVFGVWLDYEPPWWSAALIAAPIVYFVCRWNFNRGKEIEPDSTSEGDS